MNRDQVAKTWVYRGLCDLFFAFECDFDPFDDNVKFSEIMGLEKFLKAVLLYHQHSNYESLSESDARKMLNKLAKGYGHNFEKMVDEVSELGSSPISRILRTNYDGYLGSALVGAVYAGYMETRYPVPTPISDEFPIRGGITLDPLGSSGITKFIYAISNFCFQELESNVDFSDIRAQFRETFQGRESFARFSNLFWRA